MCAYLKMSLISSVITCSLVLNMLQLLTGSHLFVLINICITVGLLVT